MSRRSHVHRKASAAVSLHLADIANRCVIMSTDWTVHLPVMPDRWHLCWIFAKWSLEEHSSENMITDALAAW